MYITIHFINPDSFQLNINHSEELIDYSSYLIYYSLVTLTTVGYGDVIPLSPPARPMTTMEAVVGLLYLTILV